MGALAAVNLGDPMGGLWVLVSGPTVAPGENGLALLEGRGWASASPVLTDV